MRRKTWIIIVAAVLLSTSLAGGLYWYWARTPRYALQQMALALKTRDMDTFFKYVDLKDIFDNFLADSSRAPETPANGKTDEWTQLTRSLGRQLSRVFLPKLFEAFESQIRGVAERYLLNLDNAQILGVVAAVTTAEIDQQGEQARVTLVDPKTHDPLRFQMRREPKQGLWRIVSVNYDDVRRLSQREFCRPPR